MRAQRVTLDALNDNNISLKKAPRLTSKVAWCAVHHRVATYFDPKDKKYRCDPSKGGIMLPCAVSDFIP